jgi:D-glycero-alpha-D-manno-heptose 1-phosphate guanylyltransferase
VEIKNSLIVLAGGFGTRLKSVLNDIPKPLADINGTPFLKFILDNLIQCGFSNFIFSLHYKSEKIVDFLNSEKNNLLKNCNIQVSIEPSPLGTGGAISYVISNFEVTDNFYVLNADTWISEGYNMIETAIENDAHIALVKVKNTNRFGSVSIDKKKYITDFVEKTNENKTGLINAGFYQLNKKHFKDFKNTPFSIEKDLFPILMKNRSLKGCIINANFIDIGIPDDYYKFCKLMKHK